MTYDYADWARPDPYLVESDEGVTLSLEAFDDHAVTFVTRALGGDVTLRFTLAPRDTLDLVNRVLRFTDVPPDDRLLGIAREAREWRTEHRR